MSRYDEEEPLELALTDISEDELAEPIESTATAELATILSHMEGEGDALGEVREKEITLESEDEEARLDWKVVAPALVLISIVCVWGLGFPDSFDVMTDAAFGWILRNLGWAFVLLGTVFVLFVLVIAFSGFGKIRLGASDEQPEFRNSTWIAMMFAAGMGIGLMFYGPSEPLSFYREGVPGHNPKEVGTALATTMFHWTLHPWAIYAIVGLAIAYSTYRVGRRQLISAAFTPLIGEKRAKGGWGRAVDVLSVFATVFGTACSLGLGALQIRSGLEASGLVENPGMGLIVCIVIILMLAFLLSAISGVGKGIRILSNVNMVLACFIAIFVFAVGPTVAQLNLLPSSIGSYINDFFEMAGRTASSADGTAGEWLSGWTIFYWAWWISWSPFVGMFVARISRGRTIREFCLGVMLIPAGLSTCWFAIFGGTAIWMEQNGQSIYGSGDKEEQLFNLIHNLPGSSIVGLFAVILLATFFITSADSASTVMGSISQRGRSDASPWISGLWGLMTGLIGLTLLVSGGNNALSSIQNVTIVAATPFLFIVAALMFAIVKGLRKDVIYIDQREQAEFARKLAFERRHMRERARVRKRREEMNRLRGRLTGAGRRSAGFSNPRGDDKPNS